MLIEDLYILFISSAAYKRCNSAELLDNIYTLKRVTLSKFHFIIFNFTIFKSREKKMCKMGGMEILGYLDRTGMLKKLAYILRYGVKHMGLAFISKCKTLLSPEMQRQE